MNQIPDQRFQSHLLQTEALQTQESTLYHKAISQADAPLDLPVKLNKPDVNWSLMQVLRLCYHKNF